MQWMIYGANGYTGRLIAQEAKQRGLRPVLAGRNAEALRALAQETGFEARIFDLDPASLRHALDGIDLVLHCAGPFSATCAPMLEACLAARAHYLDITGEIDVFAHCHAQHARAMDAGILVMPGSGFDVVPTDCVAAHLKELVPDAVRLVLAFDAGGGLSPGTAKTSVEGLGKGGRARIGGEVVRVPLGWKSRTFERPATELAPAAQRTAVTIPWGDVFTAGISTGIPEVEVYTTVPPSTVKRLRRLRMLGPLLGFGPLQSWLKSRVDRSVAGPDAARRARSECIVWGEVQAPGGEISRLCLRTPNGYDITVTAALGIVQRLCEGSVPAGYHTPSQLMGADYVLGLPGVAEL